MDEGAAAWQVSPMKPMYILYSPFCPFKGQSLMYGCLEIRTDKCYSFTCGLVYAYAL